MTHRELVMISYKWLLKNGSCGVAFYELRAGGCKEIPDVIGFNSWSCKVIECKISRNDFLKDKNKAHRKKGMGNHRFYACPTGLIKINELPQEWGLIYVNEKGKATCVYNPYSSKDGNIWTNGLERDVIAEQQIMYTALRRLFIKGYMKFIYDKEYKRSSDVNELIKLSTFSL